MQMIETTRRSMLALLGVAFAAASVQGRTHRSFVRHALGARSDEFLAAVSAGNLERVRAMLTEDVALAAACDAAGRSAFVLAHMAGHAQVAGSVQKHMSRFDVVEALLAQDWERMESLFSKKPGLANALHPIGGTPLWAAARTGTGELYRLRAEGCELEAIPDGGSGTTAARAAMDCPQFSGALRAATDLLSNGGEVNHAQRGGDSVLHAAVRRREPALVRLALRKHACTTAKDAQGQTALELARKIGFAEGVALIEQPELVPRDHRASRFALNVDLAPVERIDISDVPQETQNKVTGDSHGNLASVSSFLAKDPRLIFSISDNDELAIEASAHVGNKQVMLLHLEHGAPLSLPTAVSLGRLDAIEWMLEDDPLLIHERGAHDYPLLWYVVMGRGPVEIAELLQSYGASLDQQSTGITTLHQCARRGREDLAKWLVEQGAELNSRGYLWDKEGQTPLQVARAYKQKAVTKILVDAGAKG